MKHTVTSILLAVVVCASGQASLCSDSSRTSSWAARISSLLHRLPSLRLPSCKLPSCSMPTLPRLSLSQQHKDQVKTWAPVIGVAAGASLVAGFSYYKYKSQKNHKQTTPLDASGQGSTPTASPAINLYCSEPNCWQIGPCTFHPKN